jgi:hypothetical protein
MKKAAGATNTSGSDHHQGVGKMAIQTTLYSPTPSQWASAAAHLDRRSEWRTYRVDGVRYVVLPSACSGKVYAVRAAADGCGCPFYTRTLNQCSHMLSVYLAATLDELAEDEEAPVSLKDLRNLFPPCAAGCGQVTEGALFCEDCSAARERSERMAAARRRVVEAWV